MSITTGTLSSSASTASALSALSAASSSSSARRTHQSYVDTAANALGMSSSDVTAELKSGKSLFDVADEKGLSHDDLVSALKAGAPDDLKSSSDADSVIEALASQTGVSGPGAAGGPGGAGGAGGKGGHHGPPPQSQATTGVLSGSLTSTQQSTLKSLSDLLGTDSDSLMTSLQSGSDLTDLLKQKGVSLDQLSSKLEEGLLVDARA